MPIPSDKLARGNAYTDGAPRGGWFVASFIDQTLGVRCRAGNYLQSTFPGDFELKMKRHHSRDMEKGLFPYNNFATSMSMLVGAGRFELFFCSGPDWRHVTLEKDGDYAIWGPKVGHLWMVPEASTIFTVRVPAIPGDQDGTPLTDIPDELKRLFDANDFARREKERLESIERKKQAQAGTA